MSDQPVSLSGKLIIGLTGNIATGKSVVLRMAAERGALAIDADKIVHELMDNDTEIQAAVAVAFGTEVRRPDGRIDRKALGEIVFDNASALRDLEQIVHPAVRRQLYQRIRETAASIILVEAIKLLEGDLADTCHQIWVTRCSRQRQLERLRVCRGLETHVAATRIKAQPPQEEKVARADVVIDTEGFMHETEAQFEMAWDRLPDPFTVKPVQISIAEAPPPVARTEEAAAPVEPEVEAEEVQATEAEAPPAVEIPDDVEVRRARPSDIPSIILLIRKATDGAEKLKRADLLMALGERSYFIGQQGTEISTIMGWNIENLVSRIDRLYFHPLAAINTTGAAVLQEIEKSANGHICEIVVVFLHNDSPEEVRHFFEQNGYGSIDPKKMPRDWRKAIEETKLEDNYYLVKVLRERVTHPL